MNANKMRYANPPSEWQEGLPIGNGRLAAMIWGDGQKDIIDLNHEWLWRGNNKDREVVSVAENLEYVRSLLLKRDFFKAAMAANLYFGGNGGIADTKNRVDPYQTAGFIEFKLDGFTEFERRELDIETGICEVSRKNAGSSVVSEFFASCENGLIMSKWHSDNRFSGSISLSRVEDSGAVYKITAQKNKLIFDCGFNGGVSFRVVCLVQTDGRCAVTENRLDIEGASYIKCMTNIATSVFDMEAEIDRYPADFDGFDVEKTKHADKFSGIMNGVKLEIAEDAKLNKLSIEERLNGIRAGKRDNGIVSLYFNFGRYLMLSSSISGDLPANLQGKWNNKIDPPWESDYHFDINLQMNYWMAEQCNMPQCAEALLKYLERFYESGRDAAKKLYGCRGIWLPIQTDAWGKSTPESFGWAVWIGAAPWMAQHFWHRYVYSGDMDYLKNRGYKFLKAVAEFYEDYLVEDENGIFQIMPSQSPENAFAGAFERAFPVSICVSSAMDVQLAHDALGYAVKAAKILNTDEKQAALWKKMQSGLPGFKIGPDGRLLEWDEEKTEVEPGHRHLSHLYGVYPSDLFTGKTRPEQYKAAEKSLEFRLSHGGGHTGWSRAWVACLQSRFGDAEGFYEHFIALIRDFATVSMLDLHPPGIFQIDGNFGAVAALIESVISFTDDTICLLRSLPKEWSEGSLRGIKTPGGHIVSVWWKDCEITEIEITMGFCGSVKVRDSRGDGEEKVFTGAPGEIIAKKWK
jgi:alpha-L-fucosidase 2